MNQFKLNDEVEWSSQASGFEKKKSGKVVAIIPANERAVEVYRPLQTSPKSQWGGGIKRDHESYVIEDPKGYIYWPLVRLLVMVRPATDSKKLKGKREYPEEECWYCHSKLTSTICANCGATQDRPPKLGPAPFAGVAF